MAKIDRVIDFHHYTRAQMRSELERIWGRREWHGLRRVRIIHGTGEVLGAECRRWCEEKGVQWTTEPRNPGVTILHPGERLQTPAPLLHRPLARPLLPHRAAVTQRASSPGIEPERRKKPLAARKTRPQTDMPVVSPEDARLFQEELERIDRTPPDALRRRKRA